MESTTVQLVTGLDSEGVFLHKKLDIYLFGRSQSSQTGDQLYGGIYPHKVSGCSMESAIHA